MKAYLDTSTLVTARQLPTRSPNHTPNNLTLHYTFNYSHPFSSLNHPTLLLTPSSVPNTGSCPNTSLAFPILNQYPVFIYSKAIRLAPVHLIPHLHIQISIASTLLVYTSA
jgi:hypothetical protein